MDFVIGVGRTVAWAVVAIGYLLAAGLVLELVTWAWFKLTGFRLTIKCSPMYAEWHLINWQWSHQGRHGVTVHDGEDFHERPRAINHKGGSFLPWMFRVQWSKTTLVTKSGGRLFESAEARDKHIEANRRVVVHADQEEPVHAGA